MRSIKYEVIQRHLASLKETLAVWVSEPAKLQHGLRLIAGIYQLEGGEDAELRPLERLAEVSSSTAPHHSIFLVRKPAQMEFFVGAAGRSQNKAIVFRDADSGTFVDNFSIGECTDDHASFHDDSKQCCRVNIGVLCENDACADDVIHGEISVVPVHEISHLNTKIPYSIVLRK